MLDFAFAKPPNPQVPLTLVLGSLSTPTRISVQEALRAGFWMIQVPLVSVLILGAGGVHVAMDLDIIPSKEPQSLACILLPLISAWLVWSIQTPRWRLWAYQRVEYIAELKLAAVRNGLIWPDDSVFSKTEIASRELLHELRILEERSQKPKPEQLSPDSKKER